MWKRGGCIAVAVVERSGFVSRAAPWVSYWDGLSIYPFSTLSLFDSVKFSPYTPCSRLLRWPEPGL